MPKVTIKKTYTFSWKEVHEALAQTFPDLYNTEHENVAYDEQGVSYDGVEDA